MYGGIHKLRQFFLPPLPLASSRNIFGSLSVFLMNYIGHTGISHQIRTKDGKGWLLLSGCIVHDLLEDPVCYVALW